MHFCYQPGQTSPTTPGQQLDIVVMYDVVMLYYMLYVLVYGPV